MMRYPVKFRPVKVTITSGRWARSYERKFGRSSFVGVVTSDPVRFRSGAVMAKFFDAGLKQEFFIPWTSNRSIVVFEEVDDEVIASAVQEEYRRYKGSGKQKVEMKKGVKRKEERRREPNLPDGIYIVPSIEAEGRFDVFKKEGNSWKRLWRRLTEYTARTFTYRSYKAFYTTENGIEPTERVSRVFPTSVVLNAIKEGWKE